MNPNHIINLTGEKVTDFITEGIMVIRGEHIYIKLGNQIKNTVYMFHIPKTLFCTMVRNRIMQDDKTIWRDDYRDAKENEDDKDETPTEINGMFG